jgi:hypothetical protein
MTLSPALAFDRGSVRTLDVDGRLHISVTNISKATVNPYLGNEIPGWQAMGLQPDRIYRLLRCPVELAAAAGTFNNLPILDVHMAVDAYDEGNHRPDIIIGSTGTDAAFADPYLQNSAVVWSKSAIDDVDAAIRADQQGRESDRGKREWSCAYRYTPDMTPGKFMGLPYDGVMRNIIGNHVALVKEGRAGPDVMIGDCSMKSRMGLFLSGALVGLVTPKLAADATVNLEPLLDDITADNLPGRAGKLAVSIAAAVEPHLATDQSLDMDDIVSVIASAQANPMAADAEPAPPASPPAADADPDEDGGAADADPDDDDEEAKKKAEDDAAAAGAADCDDTAMDSATVATMIADAVGRERRRAAAIATAREEVAPYIGAVTGAADSAADIYKLALDGAGINTTDVPKTSFRHMVAMLPKPGDTSATAAAMATDAAAGSSFRKRFPQAGAPSKVI